LGSGLAENVIWVRGSKIAQKTVIYLNFRKTVGRSNNVFEWAPISVCTLGILWTVMFQLQLLQHPCSLKSCDYVYFPPRVLSNTAFSGPFSDLAIALFINDTSVSVGTKPKK